MEALRTLIRGHLPPAGEEVRTEVRPQGRKPKFVGYDIEWLDSGTSALALALQTARKLRPELTAPEVIIPGYCCPDLVAAAVYAGVDVVVADISRNDPGYDLAELEACINKQTLAVIAVNFLGIQERLREIKSRLGSSAFLIEDNAQWFPDPSESDELEGDFVVFSFGRGKPVTLLGGGLLLSKPGYRAAMPPPDSAKVEANALSKCKYYLYNWLLRPQLYQCLNRNPLIKLGHTQYQPLSRVQKITPYQAQILPANIDAYRARARSNENAYETFLRAHNELHALNSPRRRRLLRYPLLLKSARQRDELLDSLSRFGLGATPMYQRPIMCVPGVAGLVRAPRPYPNAHSFSDRLMTLPVHSGVNTNHLQRIRTRVEALTPK